MALKVVWVVFATYNLPPSGEKSIANRYAEATVGALVQVIPVSVDLKTPPEAPPIPAKTSGRYLNVTASGPNTSSAQLTSQTILSMLSVPLNASAVKLPSNTRFGADPISLPPRQLKN